MYISEATFRLWAEADAIVRRWRIPEGCLAAYDEDACE